MKAAIENLLLELPTPEIDEGVMYFDLGRKQANRLSNGCFARKIQVFPSGKIRLWESETLRGKGSGVLYSSGVEVKIK